jgi:hypothetical protein
VGGVIGVVAILPAVIYGFGGLVQIIHAGWPWYPSCRTGKCRAQDYSFANFGGQLCLCCRCGMHYQKRGRRFLVVQTDGSALPYMVWKPFRGWFPDGS